MSDKNEKGFSGFLAKAKKAVDESREALENVKEAAQELQDKANEAKHALGFTEEKARMKADEKSAKQAVKAATKAAEKAEEATIKAALGKCALDTRFNLKRIRIYQGGYVQIGNQSPERLLGISGQADISSKTGLGRTAGSIGFMAITLLPPINLLGPSVRGDLMLTIVTDKETHVIHTRTPMSEDLKALRALDATGNSILGVLNSAAETTTYSRSSVSSDVSDQLIKLGELKANGIVTDEEFAAAKAKLLGLS